MDASLLSEPNSAAHFLQQLEVQQELHRLRQAEVDFLQQRLQSATAATAVAEATRSRLQDRIRLCAAILVQRQASIADYKQQRTAEPDGNNTAMLRAHYQRSVELLNKRHDDVVTLLYGLKPLLHKG